MEEKIMETKEPETVITQGQVVRAHAALQKLYNQDIPADVAFDIYMLTQQLGVIERFQQDQRKKIVDEMQPTVENNGATLNFGTPERCQEYRDRINKLAEMPADIKIQPVRLFLSPRLVIAPTDIEVLEGFVEFYK